MKTKQKPIHNNVIEVKLISCFRFRCYYLSCNKDKETLYGKRNLNKNHKKKQTEK